MIKNLVISISGGRTSAYLAIHVKELVQAENYYFVFANTGFEHPGTIEFLRQIQDNEDINIVVVEDCPQNKFIVKSLDSLSMQGEPFISISQKYGLPNRTRPFCSNELKAKPITAYCVATFGKGNYHTAIVIRSDEVDRISKDRHKRRKAKRRMCVCKY